MNHNDDMQPEPWVLPHMLPVGCDKQGRYITRPMPAEACTEVGCDEPDFTAAAVARSLFWLAYGSSLFVALVAAAAVFL